jgi:outer membrane receptor protein involved in Fe transport
VTHLTWAQTATATLTGTVKDKKDNTELIGVNVLIKGTSLGAVTDVNGKFTIKNIKHGEYDIEMSYIGYNKTLLTGIKLGAGETKDLQVSLIPTSVTSEDVVIIGKKPLIDIDKAQSVHSIGQDAIELAPARQLQSIVNTQPGVIQSPAGVSIRGGRTYETGVYVDGVKVTDPLGGTGFGLDIGSNAISDIDVTTGGIGADIGDATAGVINTKTKSGGDKIELGISYKRDNFGFNKDYKSCWNSQVAELSLGGPLFKKTLSNRLKFMMTLRGAFTDDYYKNPANQLYTSLYPGSDGKGTLWTPYQDNRWSAFFKMNYQFKKGMVLSVSQLRSITVNQDLNMLRIFGNDLPFAPGYQYEFSQQMDNANTYTHDSYLTMVNWKQFVNKRFSYDATLSRLFVRLRADANGLPWRPDVVVNQLDPQSINLYPATYFNPGDNIAYINNPSGFYNNNGIATLWHDHYFVENVLKAVGNYSSKNAMSTLSFGVEMKFQEMQWIDIIRPWVGAPLPLADGTQSQTYRLGQQSDIWKVKPQRGAIFVSDLIKYKGLVASIGGRFEYWAPGKYVDEAIANPDAPILEATRQSYLDHTTQIGGLRYKFRFLPKISASFPIRENQMLYFNYGHTTILPHPSYVYAGLNPYYQDRSTIANVGNPDLNPEVDISYEIGLKTQITSNDAFTFSAFWKDKYDFITSTSVLIPDATGREVARTMRINSAYARTRGVELGYIKRIGNWYNGQAGITYMVTTGQSSSANEALKEILANGAAEDTKEFYLPWDCPIDFKTNHTFKIDRKTPLYGKKILNQWSVYFETVMRSGVRYTPYNFAYNDPNTGRPIYVVSTNPNDKWSKVGEYWFWADLTVTKWWKVKSTRISLNLTVTNLFDNKNASIINPVTGKAYENGDNVPDTWVDPRYNNPKQGVQGPPPANPARYLAQRHIVTGIAIKF